VNNFKKVAQLVLFATSYIPLFILIIVKQISENISFLSWGGLNIDAVLLCFQKFGLSIFASLISVFGMLGSIFTFSKLEKDSKNGDIVTIINVDNKNSESAGYIATYITPFLYQGFDGWYELAVFIFLMIIIYIIYVNSNMILINPILNIVYPIFQIEYKEQNGKERNALIITRNKYLIEDTKIKIYPIGFKLFYAAKH
jgi:hypothetical protein